MVFVLNFLFRESKTKFQGRQLGACKHDRNFESYVRSEAQRLASAHTVTRRIALAGFDGAVNSTIALT